jgi:hypothetical protein
VAPASFLIAFASLFSPGICWIGCKMSLSGSEVQILQMYS